jgi:hypothetical protein
MPLPIPQVRARAHGNIVHVTIEKDAWFEMGKTTFSFDDPTIAISGVIIPSGRTAELTCSTPDLKGKKVFGK